MTTHSDFGAAAFRALLMLYPRAFRERFEDEMVEFYRARRDEQRHRHGSWGGFRLWSHLIADVAISAPAQHVRAASSPRELPFASPEYPEETYPMDTLRQDFRYALRSLARHPAFAMVAALTLALGIGANTAIFSVVDAVLLRPLPWPDDDRLVAISTVRGQNQSPSAYLDYKDWREQSTAFAELGVIRGQSINFTGGETPERLIGQFIDAGTFRMLGATAMQGRLFTNSETEVATKEPSAVIGDALWRTRFGSRPDILGTTMVLNGVPFTVVGVLRPGFTTPYGTPDVYMPIGYYPNAGDLENRGRGGVAVFGKLRPGVTIEAAQTNLEGVAKRLAELYPNTNAGSTVGLQSLKEVLVGPSRTPLFMVLASVAVVLLIACANVANLQLARATARRRELSVRAALGAGRHRLVRQLLTENIVLSTAGGIGGLLIAYAGVRWFASVADTLFPISTDVKLSQGVLVFAALVTLATALVFGLAPAWSATRTRLQDTLTLRGDSGGSRLRAHNAVVVAQVALCVVLLVSAGLLTRSLMALSRVDPGFDAKQVLTMHFRLPASAYNTEEKISAMFTRTIDEVRAVPGVRHAALVRATPLNGNGETLPYAIAGTAIEPERLPRAHLNIVSNDFFETMKIPLRSGRDFETGDQAATMPVAIINEQLANKVAPTGSALGKRIRLSPTDTTTKWATVVGIVGNAKHFQINEAQLDQIYVPYQQRALIFTELVVRGDGDPTTLSNAVRAAIWRVDRDQPVWRVRPLMLSIENQLGGRTFTMRLLGSFAILAVVLALIGVYGVMSYAVARRTQEMGIRMALGAGGRQVVRMVLGQGLKTIGIAIVIGLVAAFGVTRLLETQLFGVKPTDPLTFALVPMALAVVAIAACYLPARRASRVDPLIALRSE
jgi:putative ABC transport system permease protein